MALAIQTVAQRVRSKHKEKTVQDFKYRDKEWESLFLDALSNVTFEGVTVSIQMKLILVILNQNPFSVLKAPRLLN